ncbi:unnamed protein product, partial [Iphiclides podalirius]
MQGDDPPFLPVGTDVTLKAGGITTVNDDMIKGTLRVGSTVEVKQDPKKDAMEAVITKIQDCSQYTVVFDDGDITTLRRSALCLKSGRHFNESETLDQLPLTHPEHFSTPVIAGRRGRRGRAQSEESEGEGVSRRVKADSEPHVGRVVLVEAGSGAERRRPHQPAFPALVVAPTAQIKVKEDYLVRSFKDGRYYTVPKKEAREFRKGSAPLEWAGVEAALQYLNNGVLPPHWDRDTLFNEPRNTSDDSSDDEPREEKDHFVAQLYKFMDDRGTPLNRNPTIANRDIDLYRLFRVVQKLGGYNRVTNQNQWKTIADKMGFHPVTTSITNLCKQAYKKFLHSFEDFYRKLGVTLVAHPRGARTPPAGRSLIRDRDKQPPTSSSASSTPTGTPAQRGKEKDSDKSETEKSDKSEKEDKVEKIEKPKEKIQASDEEDSADNQPLIVTAPKVEKEKEKEKEREKEKEKEKEKDKDKEKGSPMSTGEEKAVIKPRSQSKTRSLSVTKTDSHAHEKRTPKRRPFLSKAGEGTSVGTPRASRRPHASTDSDSSGRASSRCGPTKKMQSRRSQSANSASSGNTIASNSSKRPRKRKSTEPSMSESTRSGGVNTKAQVGDKLKVYYGPTQSESKVTYEAKVIEISSEGMLRVHYTGWNTRYDEWIKPQRIALNVTQHDAHNKKNTSLSRRARSKRTEESSARSDTDSDSDSDDDIKRALKKPDDKSSVKTPPRSKDAKSSDSSGSSNPRKRPVRTSSTPSLISPAKKPRVAIPGHQPQHQHQHQGRDYDLNEIRSELKGLHSVKQETEEPLKVETQKERNAPSPMQTPLQPPEPPQPEKQPEDVYEFKEPEPFEIELHDEKKKRTHRIFDDISPSKYTSTLSKSLSEEISEDALRPRTSTLRSPSLSPFRDFAAARELPDRQSPEEDSKDGLFSLDDDSFPGDGSSGPIFEGFTPAKNQETYSKKSKVTKLRELIDDSPDSPADDERSSEDENEGAKQESEQSPPEPTLELTSVTEVSEPMKEEAQDVEPVKEEIVILLSEEQSKEIPEPPKTPPLQIKLELPNTSVEIVPSKSPTATSQPIDESKKSITPVDKEDQVQVLLIPLPAAEPKESMRLKIDKLDPDPVISKMEPPSSPLIDTEEDKSEPDSPARIDVLPEPPPGFLLQSEGPKIAEKLLKAINSAKILSMSPPPVEERPLTPGKDALAAIDEKPSPISPAIKPLTKPEPLKPPGKVDPIKKISPLPVADSIFGEPSNFMDPKRDLADMKKTKSKEPTPPRLQSPLSVLERRKSVAELPLSAPGKNNKVLSDTIQKLSSQINQSAASIPLPPFPPGDRSESSDSDDSDRRLIIDKVSMEEWAGGGGCEAAGARALHAGKSPGEWSAGETLLMLEDACKNERKHSASVVVAGSGRPGTSAAPPPAACAAAAEEDSNISLLLCEETIPGSPAPDAEPAPPRHKHTLPFACAPPHHSHSKAEERRNSGGGRAGEGEEAAGMAVGGGGGGAGGAGAAPWTRRHALIDNTPPTTPDSSLDMSPQRERRISERDSPSERKEDEEEPHGHGSPAHDMDKPRPSRSRKASESSLAGRGRTRRSRRDTDDNAHAHAPHNAHAHAHQTLKYNFIVDLDPSWDCQKRINVLTSRLADLRKTYHSVKAELAAIDRRRKKLRRKEREAVKAAKAACS